MKPTRNTLIVFVVLSVLLSGCGLAGFGGGKSCDVVLVEQYYLNDINMQGEPDTFAFGEPVNHKIDVSWVEPEAPGEGAAPTAPGKAGWQIDNWQDMNKEKANIEGAVVTKASRINSHFRGLAQFGFTVEWPELPDHVKDLPKVAECPEGGFVYEVGITLTSEVGIVQTDVSQIFGTDGKPTDVFFTAKGNGWSIEQFHLPYASLVSVLDGSIANANVPVKLNYGTAPATGLLSGTDVIAQGIWLKEQEPAMTEMTVLLERIAAFHPTGNQLTLYVTTQYDSIELVNTFTGNLILEKLSTAVATSTATIQP